MADLMDLLTDEDGRTSDDVIAAFLFDWFHGVVTPASLRFIAEEMSVALFEQGFAVVPCDNIPAITQWLAERGAA